MKYYIIAGERSGDLHASNLVKSLKKLDVNTEVRGMGGEYLSDAGATLFLNYKEISFMGFAEVAMNLNKISKAMKAVKRDIVAYNPDVLILVDFAGFNLRIAKFAKASNIKVFYYISPKIWAWNQARAYKIKAVVDRMFVIMPFEKAFYARFGFEKVDYIGNPLLDAVEEYRQDTKSAALSGSAKFIAVLPGSRKQEITVMMEKLSDLIHRFSDYEFVVAGVRNVDQSLYKNIENLPNVSLYFDRTYDILSSAEAAIVTSGTATLETALFEVPQVVVYKTSLITYQIVKRLIKVEYISLVNLIAGKEIVKELIQQDFKAEKVSDELRKILSGGKSRAEIIKEYNELKKLLGASGASARAAKLIHNYLIS